jgi:hypothetical protein
MPDDATPVPARPPLTAHQRRVLGVLIEKQKTSKSADTYPMTLNSVTVGCNQKTNRDPVLDLDEDTVEETLLDLGKLGLVMRMTGNRVDRFRHLLYEQWKVTKVEMAVLAELLLRGSQTEGDLRGRASRMDDIPDLDALRAVLAPLVERNLVLYLSEPGRRGTVVAHGFYQPDELERERLRHAAGAAETEPSRGGSRLDELAAEVAALKDRVARLEAKSSEYARTGKPV